MKNLIRLWLARCLIGIVLFFNIQCALAFLFFPQYYISGFELAGKTGEAMLRGMGVLFLMWNVPYLLATWHPIKNRISFVEAIVMQLIGVSGESAILLTLSGNHAIIQASILRFIIFDSAGLAALILALCFVYRNSTSLKVKT